MGFIVYLLVGALAGWMAGKIMRGGGFGLIKNMALGIVGSLIGGHVLGWFGVNMGGLVGSTATAVFGAVILLWVVGMFSNK